jgi:hypothetical protein
VVFNSFLLQISALFLFGCQVNKPTPVIEKPFFSGIIDSYGNDPLFKNKKYILLPFDSSVSENYLQYELFCSYINKVLKQKNLVSIKSIDSSDYIIFLKYGVSERQVFEKDIYAPIFGQTGQNIYNNTSGEIQFYPGQILYKENQNINTQSKYGLVSEVPYKTTEYFYSHYLSISAFNTENIKKNFSRSLKWKLIARSDRSDTDLRKSFPYLLLASEKFFGIDSKFQTENRIQLDDKKIPWLIHDLPDNFLTDTKNFSKYISTTEKKEPSEEEKEIIEFSKNNDLNKFQKIKNSDQVKINEKVIFKTDFGEIVHGVIIAIENNNFSIATYPTKNNRVVTNCRLRELYKLK